MEAVGLPAGGAGLGSFTAETVAAVVVVGTPAEFLFTPGGTGGAWFSRSPMLGEALVLAEVDTGAPGVWTDREMTAPMRSW